MAIYEIEMDAKCTSGPNCMWCGHKPSSHEAVVKMKIDTEKGMNDYFCELKECHECKNCTHYKSSI